MTIEWYIKNVVMKDLGRTVFTPGVTTQPGKK